MKNKKIVLGDAVRKKSKMLGEVLSIQGCNRLALSTELMRIVDVVGKEPPTLTRFIPLDVEGDTMVIDSQCFWIGNYLFEEKDDVKTMSGSEYFISPIKEVERYIAKELLGRISKAFGINFSKQFSTFYVTYGGFTVVYTDGRAFAMLGSELNEVLSDEKLYHDIEAIVKSYEYQDIHPCSYVDLKKEDQVLCYEEIHSYANSNLDDFSFYHVANTIGISRDTFHKTETKIKDPKITPKAKKGMRHRVFLYKIAYGYLKNVKNRP